MELGISSDANLSRQSYLELHPKLRISSVFYASLSINQSINTGCSVIGDFIDVYAKSTIICRMYALLINPYLAPPLLHARSQPSKRTSWEDFSCSGLNASAFTNVRYSSLPAGLDDSESGPLKVDNKLNVII